MMFVRPGSVHTSGKQVLWRGRYLATVLQVAYVPLPETSSESVPAGTCMHRTGADGTKYPIGYQPE